MSKTLVVVLSETRESELTFDNFKKNVIDYLEADLCVCIGVKPDYDYNNPFYKLAKYKFTYPEPDDFGYAFDYAHSIISKDSPKYETLKDTNGIYSKLQNPIQSTENITYYGTLHSDIKDFSIFNDNEIVVHTKDFPDESWKNKVHCIKTSYGKFVSQENVITYKKPLHWREFLKIKDPHNEHPGSAAILIFFRWFLLKNLLENDLINKYDKFIITRSDFIYQLLHPKVEYMNENCIWIPDCEHYGGYTDRHVVLSKNNIVQYLNILNNLILKSNEYFIKMQNYQNWNLEQLIKLHLEQNNVLHLVKEFPYIMYSVRSINGSTRWTPGVYSNELGYNIKYCTEYNKSTYYKNEFENSGLIIDEFYDNLYYKSLPLIGLGVGGYDYETTYNAVLQALKIGYRLIDTAENYHNEEAVGNAIIDSGVERSKIKIISKYFGGEQYGNSSDVLNSFNNSLKRLKTHYIDIYLIHFPFGCKWVDEWEPIIDNKFINYKNRLSVWLELIKLKKQNLVNHIGVSNWTYENIIELQINNLSIPDIIQIEWCPSFHDDKLYNFCNDNNIKIIGYGLFSRNNYHIKSEILIKWCTQKNIIVIPRSNNYENLLTNFNTVKDISVLPGEEISKLDNLIQKDKGHCLKSVYEKNISINIWNPFILDTSKSYSNKLDNLINGDISCIIVNNVITTENCIAILKKMEDKELLAHQLPYNNHDINFRYNEIGITIDNLLWRDNPEKYFDECIKTNLLFENTFDNNLNPLEIMFDTLQKIIGDKYLLRLLKNEQNTVQCPKGVFRIFSQNSHEFPYHTDGFNCGKILNEAMKFNLNLFPEISKINEYQNNLIAIILVLQQTKNNKNETDLYNISVNELEMFKDELGMYSHWMGTKYSNNNALELKLQDKQFFSPILNTGDLYIFSASRIHKLNNFINSDNRIVLATFGYVTDTEIVLYQ